MDIRELFRVSFSTARRRRNLIIFFVLTHTVFLFFGQWTVAQGFPRVLELRAELFKEIQDLPYLKPLAGVLAESLLLKILYTFFFNLFFGAFISTTVMGVLFFLPYTIAVWRSFVIGVLYYGLDVTALQSVVFYGTAILEFGAYCVSSAAGTDIGLSLLWPGFRGVASRREAFIISARDGLKLYLIVAILLFLGALWEMGWLHYLGPLVIPENTTGIR